MLLVSHDMRLISQVAKEIWMVADHTVKKYKGDIMKFKLSMRQELEEKANVSVCLYAYWTVKSGVRVLTSLQ
jgi:ATPase subunit of ABC transporter with duplicated ATPase domains